MARLFFNILPFKTMKICPISKIAKISSEFWETLKIVKAVTIFGYFHATK